MSLLKTFATWLNITAIQSKLKKIYYFTLYLFKINISSDTGKLKILRVQIGILKKTGRRGLDCRQINMLGVQGDILKKVGQRGLVAGKLKELGGKCGIFKKVGRRDLDGRQINILNVQDSI